MIKPIQLFKVYMSDKAPEEVSKVLMSGYIGQGHKVDEFHIWKDIIEREYLRMENNIESEKYFNYNI